MTTRRTPSIGLVCVLIAAAWAVPPTSAGGPQAQQAQAPPPQVTPQARQMADALSVAFEAAASKVSASVVPIYAEEVVQAQGSPFGSPDDPFQQFFGNQLRRFFGQPQPQTVHSLGSGVIISGDGLILTNNHVVAGAQTLNVVLPDKRSVPAKVVGADPETDVAVIRISAPNLAPANLGNSDAVRVGQWVVAVGNPFQLLSTVTAGIISAKGRSQMNLADYEDFIQTDASINPGNSGGALADLDGNVIAINTAIASPGGQGSIGIGFAIPINMARDVMNALIKNGRVVRGYLALIPQDIDPDLQKAMNLPSTQGALIAEVTPGGPAEKAGLRSGDVITGFNGQTVTDSTQLRNMVAAAAPGTAVRLDVLRDGKPMTLTATLGERPAPQANRSLRAPREPGPPAASRLGLKIQTLTPDIANQLQLKGITAGALIVDVAGGSPADQAGLTKGDVVVEVNKTPVRTADDFVKAVQGLRSGTMAALLVHRDGGSAYVAIKIP